MTAMDLAIELVRGAADDTEEEPAWMGAALRDPATVMEARRILNAALEGGREISKEIERLGARAAAG